MFSNIFISTAYAQTAAPAQPGPLEMFLPFVVIFGIFYFLIIRPQTKRQKQHQKFLGELKRGDQVITTGGILGTIEGLTEQFVTMEIADGIRVKVLRSAVSQSQQMQVQQQKEEKK